jgi:hypothetical protein
MNEVKKPIQYQDEKLISCVENFKTLMKFQQKRISITKKKLKILEIKSLINKLKKKPV